MSLRFDHVALFCEPEARAERAALERAGFCTSFGRKHHGQGTSNRLALFEDNYLELIWIDERHTAATNPLRINERYAAGDGASFGVGLRPETEIGDQLAHWTEYRLKGFERGHLRVRPDTFDDPTLPLIFAMVLNEGVMLGPAAQGHSDELFTHACGATGVRSVVLAGPGYGALSREGIPDSVQFIESRSRRLQITLDGTNVPRGVSVGPYATVD